MVVFAVILRSASRGGRALIKVMESTCPVCQKSVLPTVLLYRSWETPGSHLKNSVSVEVVVAELLPFMPAILGSSPGDLNILWIRRACIRAVPAGGLQLSGSSQVFLERGQKLW